MSVRNKMGFSLIEILLVIVIIGVLAAMVVPNFAGQGEKARRAAAGADIEVNLATALDLYELDNGRYPTTEQGLVALIREPSSSPIPKNWGGSYLKKKKIPKDPWGAEYAYTCPGSNNSEDYDLSSLGADGIESEDDITNWEQDQELDE